MPKHRPKPMAIQVPDGQGGLQWYDAQVFLINTKDEKGAPRLCTRLPDGHTIDLDSGEEFMICYMNRKMLEKE